MGAEFLMRSSKTRSRTEQPVSSARTVRLYDVHVKWHSGRITHQTHSKLELRFKWGSQLLPTNSRFWHAERSHAVLLWMENRIMVSWQAMKRSDTHQTPCQFKGMRAKAVSDNTFVRILQKKTHFPLHLCYIPTHADFITKPFMKTWARIESCFYCL